MKLQTYIALVLSSFLLTLSAHSQTDSTMQKVKEAMATQDTATQKTNLQIDLGFKPEKLSLSERIAKPFKPYIPEVYEKEEKVRLKLSFPWRDPIDIPYIKGLTKADQYPPNDPTIAWQRSLLVPGWGQMYNGSTGRLLIFYPGYVGAFLWLQLTNQQYQDYRTAYTCRLNNSTSDNCTALITTLGVDGFDANGIRTRRNSWRTRREQAYLILAGWHVIQIAEAYVNAHLNDFDVSEDLGFQLHTGPSVLPPMGFSTAAPGWGISLRF